MGLLGRARTGARDPARAVWARSHEPTRDAGGRIRSRAWARARPRCVFRLPQQRDRVALAYERRSRLLARAARRRRGSIRAELLRVGSPPPEVDELLEVIQEGGMPPTSYTVIHPSARLSDAERATLLAAMRQRLAIPRRSRERAARGRGLARGRALAPLRSCGQTTDASEDMSTEGSTPVGLGLEGPRLFEASPEASFVLRGSRIEAVNERFVEMLGHDPTGGDVRETVPDWRDDRSAETPLEAELRCPEGSSLPVEVRMRPLGDGGSSWRCATRAS